MKISLIHLQGQLPTLNTMVRSTKSGYFQGLLVVNVKEETTKAVVWISLPNPPTELFAMKALLSIVSVVGKYIAIDKATQTKWHPSTERVKVILDLMDKLPDKLRLQFLDKQTDQMVEVFQYCV